MHHLCVTLIASVATVAALCPMADLSRRGLAPEDIKETYLQGKGLPLPNRKTTGRKRQNNPNPILDPLSGILSPLGFGSIVPREEHHRRAVEEHVRSRLGERIEEADINAAILTPKAHKRYVEERGLLGGILAPLTGPLQALDVPTPQDSGLKLIPGDDPTHRYIAPGPTDVRGDCPTLNTLANHGYLSRDGITNFAESANAIQTAYSMSYDIAVFLAALGLMAGGDPITGKYSIGGRDSRVPETLGQPLYGIDKHGLFEIDGSISRGDRYFGDNHSFNITRWNKLVTDANIHGNGLFNVDAVKNNAADQVEASRAQNPEFVMGGNFPVIYATRALLTRPLANGTTPNTPDFKNIAPFYLNETFPEYWYRIPNSYSLVDLLHDVGDFFLFRPQPLGRNYDGRFVPLNITLPTAAADIACFGFSVIAQTAPNNVDAVVQVANAVKDQILGPLLGSAACDISNYDKAGGDAAYSYPDEDTDAGSGSGITHFGEWDSLSEKPTGISAGQTTR